MMLTLICHSHACVFAGSGFSQQNQHNYGRSLNSIKSCYIFTFVQKGIQAKQSSIVESHSHHYHKHWWLQFVLNLFHGNYTYVYMYLMFFDAWICACMSVCVCMCVCVCLCVYVCVLRVCMHAYDHDHVSTDCRSPLC